MKNTYIIIAVIAVLLIGAVLVFRGGKKAEAPLPTEQTENPVSPNSPVTQNPPVAPGVVCTMEVRSCPDGSTVGRVPPKCQFAVCPRVNDLTK